MYFLQTLIYQLHIVLFRPNSRLLGTLSCNVHLQEVLLQMAIRSNEMTFADYNALLNECVSQKAIREGRRVHAHMIKTEYLPPVFSRTRLIDFYNKCDSLDDARRVLDEMPERNVVSWTAMISAYSRRGHASEALDLFIHMLRSGIVTLHTFT